HRALSRARSRPPAARARGGGLLLSRDDLRAGRRLAARVGGPDAARSPLQRTRRRPRLLRAVRLRARADARGRSPAAPAPALLRASRLPHSSALRRRRAARV